MIAQKPKPRYSMAANRFRMRRRSRTRTNDEYCLSQGWRELTAETVQEAQRQWDKVMGGRSDQAEEAVSRPAADAVRAPAVSRGGAALNGTTARDMLGA